MRSCGSCTLCCTLTAVPEFNKPVNDTCRFCDKGCKIYRTRPNSCREFKCAWLQGLMPGWMRPDKVHVMIEILPDVPVVLALPESGYEEAWYTQKIGDLLKSYFRDEGTAVATKADGQLMVLTPEGVTKQDVVDHIKSAAREMGVIA